jgi:hypothetical protein
MPKTGERGEMTGNYEGNDPHKERIVMYAGRTFPPCSHCHRAIEWSIVMPGR